jgi:hypothetical protein
MGQILAQTAHFLVELSLRAQCGGCTELNLIFLQLDYHCAYKQGNAMLFYLPKVTIFCLQSFFSPPTKAGFKFQLQPNEEQFVEEGENVGSLLRHRITG